MKLSFPKNSNQISLGPQAWRLKHRLCSEIAMNIDYCVQEKFSKINPKKNPQKKGKIPKNQFQQTFQVFLLGLNLKFENFQSGPWRFQTKKIQSEPPRKLSNKKISKKNVKKNDTFLWELFFRQRKGRGELQEAKCQSSPQGWAFKLFLFEN